MALASSDETMDTVHNMKHRLKPSPCYLLFYFCILIFISLPLHENFIIRSVPDEKMSHIIYHPAQKVASL